jgi:SAM-dependent methyltransferase
MIVRSAPEATEFDAYNASYDDKVNEALSFVGLKVDFFTRVKAHYLLDILHERCGDIKKLAVLDVGCGIGNYHSILVDRFRSLTGTDVSGECIERARERNVNVAYEIFDGRTLPFEQSFDAAYAINVFHHVRPDDRSALLDSIHRSLKPGGMFVLFEHNPRNPLTMRVVNNCEFDHEAVLLTRQAAEQLVVKAGFKEVTTRFILAIPPLGILLRSVDRLFSRLPIGAQYYTVGRAVAR